MSFLCLLAAGLFAQDAVFNLNTTDKSYSADVYALTEPVRLTTLDKKVKTLEFTGWTLIQVWSSCCGAEPEFWNEARAMEEHYTPMGLRCVSVNFENGTLFRDQLVRVQDFLKNHEAPKELYMDTLGYCTDVLKVRGFPTFLLVNEKNEVVFFTNGKDPEGMSLLRQEIDKRMGVTP
ncbi:MAG: hypothetical protein H6510_09685 [Acidobacteria bacterium]|nr:hypothetical protein [Acidobacteriota bacterium]MCB9398077.1 hypothetical protein [Acidobacteriota bacterium]